MAFDMSEIAQSERLPHHQRALYAFKDRTSQVEPNLTTLRRTHRLGNIIILDRFDDFDAPLGKRRPPSPKSSEESVCSDPPDDERDEEHFAHHDVFVGLDVWHKMMEQLKAIHVYHRASPLRSAQIAQSMAVVNARLCSQHVYQKNIVTPIIPSPPTQKVDIWSYKIPRKSSASSTGNTSMPNLSPIDGRVVDMEIDEDGQPSPVRIRRPTPVRPRPVRASPVRVPSVRVRVSPPERSVFDPHRELTPSPPPPPPRLVQPAVTKQPSVNISLDSPIYVPTFLPTSETTTDNGLPERIVVGGGAFSSSIADAPTASTRTTADEAALQATFRHRLALLDEMITLAINLCDTIHGCAQAAWYCQQMINRNVMGIFDMIVSSVQTYTPPNAVNMLCTRFETLKVLHETGQRLYTTFALLQQG